MKLQRFVNVVAIVVGGGSGIGAATVRRLSAEGARVWVADLNPDDAHVVAAGVDGAMPVLVDVGSVALIDEMLRQIHSTGARPDVLVNCVGLPLPGGIHETDDHTWERSLHINLTGTFRTCRAILPSMMERGRGAVVNVASGAALVADAGFSVG